MAVCSWNGIVPYWELVDTMMKPYTAFAMVGIASALCTLILINYHEHLVEYIWINIVIGALCLIGMVLVSRKRRSKVA